MVVKQHTIQTFILNPSRMLGPSLLLCLLMIERIHLVRADNDAMKEEFEHLVKDLDKIAAKEDIEGHVKANGVLGIASLLEDKLENFRKEKINLGIAGSSGSGKSSLVNTMRGIRPSDEGAAEVGVTETTKKQHKYSHPNFPNYFLYDLPGVGTPNFPKHSYIHDVRLERYHCLIICTQKRFTENDLWLAQESRKLHIPYVFVRTHVDVDINNAVDDQGDYFNEEKLLDSMQFEIQMYLSANNLPSDAVFLISTRLRDTGKWHYLKLMQYVMNSLPEEAEEAFALSLVAKSREVIQLKKDILQQRISYTALYAALSQGFVGKGETVLDAECLFYKEQLGLIPLSMPSNVAENIVFGGLKRAVFGATTGAVLGIAVPAITMTMTTVYSSWTSYGTYKQFLTKKLSEMTDLALNELKLQYRPPYTQHKEL